MNINDSPEARQQILRRQCLALALELVPADTFDRGAFQKMAQKIADWLPAIQAAIGDGETGDPYALLNQLEKVIVDALSGLQAGASEQGARADAVMAMAETLQRWIYDPLKPADPGLAPGASP